MKVYQFAKELDLETIALMDKIKKWGLPVKSHMAALDDETIELIKKKLSEESGKSSKKAKKTTKKAKAKKKTATKKTAKKKTAKKVTKKKVSQNVTKVSSGKSGVSPTVETKTKASEESQVTKTPTKSVIRRKASEVQEAKEKEEEALAAKLAAEAAKQSEDLAVEGANNEESASEQTASSSSASDAQSETESVKPSAPTPPTKKARVFGKNIVGKIDLNKVSPQRRLGQGSSTAGPGSRPAAPGHRSAQRGLRSGFVAPSPVYPVDVSSNNYDKYKKDDKAAAAKKKTGATGKENTQNTQAFKAADFRKREMVFQPKKKKVSSQPGRKTEITTPAAHKRVVKVDGQMSLTDLAQEMGVKAGQLVKAFIMQGEMASINSVLDFDTISLVVPEFGWEAENVHRSEQDYVDSVAFGDLEAESSLRSPVVTVMGHVDHGKTTLLDSIRKANVAGGEAGGITQHIGAYQVFVEEDKPITFIDTPGHAAFTEMRARGANVTDIVVLVVAADDGMMPQTIEAISHAKAAGVPIIVAVNKIDKEGANPDKIKQQLSEKELVPEEWGGETVFHEVSALNKIGIKELLESIWLHSEILELKANPKRSGSGVVIESKVEKGKGNVATILVKEGTVKTGQYICAGVVSGKIRRLMSDQGKVVNEAGPSVPVEVMGLSETPKAGDRFDICESDQKATELAESRKHQQERQALEDSSKKVSIEDLLLKVKDDGAKELPVILKTDVAGSIEAIKGMVEKIETDEVKVNFIHTAVGGVTESDVLLASTAGGVVIGFNVRPDSQATLKAKEKSVEIKSYRIIYELVDELKLIMSGLLDPDVVEKETGKAEVRETFSVPKYGVIAGSFVTEGSINRNDLVRLIREGRVLYEGKISSLRRFKDDAKEVANGYECGIGIENYNDLKTGDIIEAYKKEEVAREL